MDASIPPLLRGLTIVSDASSRSSTAGVNVSARHTRRSRTRRSARDPGQRRWCWVRIRQPAASAPMGSPADSPADSESTDAARPTNRRVRGEGVRGTGRGEDRIVVVSLGESEGSKGAEVGAAARRAKQRHAESSLPFGNGGEALSKGTRVGRRRKQRRWLRALAHADGRSRSDFSAGGSVRERRDRAMQGQEGLCRRTHISAERPRPRCRRFA